MSFVNKKVSIAPWLSVSGSLKALQFYQDAFGVEVVYKLDIPGGIVGRLSLSGAEFWIAEGNENELTQPPVRMILTTPEPDTLFDQAVKAGAKVLSPVHEEHGWRVGRLVDPFGHHWEIGHEL
jgi:PhnB protein